MDCSGLNNNCEQSLSSVEILDFVLTIGDLKGR